MKRAGYSAYTKKSSCVLLSFFAIALTLSFFSCTESSGSEIAKEPKLVGNDTLQITDGVKNEKKGLTRWNIVEDLSKVNFEVNSLGKKVNGSLGGLTALIYFDEQNLAQSSIEASVRVDKLITGDLKRNEDLMREKYFNQPVFNQIVFRSTEIVATPAGYLARGTLSMKGMALPLEMSFTFEKKNGMGVFKSHFDLKRLDYSIGGAGPMIGRDVNVSLEVYVTDEQTGQLTLAVPYKTPLYD